MPQEHLSSCPGCGVQLPESDAPRDPRYTASPACLALYGELTGYTVAIGYRAGDFNHQLLVDAYAAQHASDQSKPIGLVFALVGLYLVNERGETGAQVQRVHGLLANSPRKPQPWPRIPPRIHAGSLTVADVQRAEPGDTRDAALRAWHRSVWEAWRDQREAIATLIADVLGE